MFDLTKFSTLDTMATVVDAFNFFKDFGSADTLLDRKMTDDEQDGRTIVNLLTEQVEFANVILLNKTDLVSPGDLELLNGILKKLNPDARIIDIEFGKVNPKEIINTKLFDYEAAEQAAGWIKELNSTHTPETEEYGISSFVFKNARPFHPDRLWSYVNYEWPANVLRSKGFFWMASRPEHALLWSQAGGSTRAELYGRWWAAVPFRERAINPSYLQNQEIIMQNWNKVYGDRMNQLVIIGQDLNKNEINRQLEKCLCSLQEWEQFKTNKHFSDVWPV